MTFDVSQYRTGYSLGVGGVVPCDDRALLVHRSPGNGPGADTWALPGGFVERHESVHAAVQREVFEEKGYSGSVAMGICVLITLSAGVGLLWMKRLKPITGVTALLLPVMFVYPLMGLVSQLIEVRRTTSQIELLHYFRLGLEASRERTSSIMRFAGCWQELPDEVFDTFIEDIAQRRHQAYSRRRASEAGLD
jgi:8-oxo-dGTP pyrophosphatase MutT (NUDIX family)